MFKTRYKEKCGMITTQLVFSLFCLLYGKNPFKFYSPNPSYTVTPLPPPPHVFNFKQCRKANST